MVDSDIYSGYLASCKAIVGAAQTIARAVTEEIPELYILGKPPASCVAFASKHPRVNVLAVGDRMSARGWHLNGLQKPAGLHIACTVSSFFMHLGDWNVLPAIILTIFVFDFALFIFDTFRRVRLPSYVVICLWLRSEFLHLDVMSAFC